jgi:hypothetical protein
MGLLAFVPTYAQVHNYQYAISVHGKSVGALQVRQQSAADSVVVLVTSAIRTRVVFLFTANATEKAIFQRGRLKYSSIARQVNNDQPTRIETHDMGSVYHSQKRGENMRITKGPIYHNMSSLYLMEPVAFRTVYSDMFQDFLKIIFVAPHHYKILLPDGNYNEYYYANGHCRQLQVHHTLFTAQMDLVSATPALR